MINDNTSDVRMKALEAIIAVAVILMAAAILFAPVNADEEEEYVSPYFEWDDYTFKIESEEDLTVCIDSYWGNDKIILIPGSVQHDFKTYSVVAIDTMAFWWIKAETVIIPEGVTEIRNNAFASSDYLKNIYIPSTVTSIGDAAFRNCPALESITIPSTVQTLGHSLFEDDENLVSVTLPDNMKEIPADMFYGCKSLKSIDMPATVEVIGDYAFSGTAFTEFDLGPSLKTIGASAFEGVPLTVLYLPDSLRTIGDSAFADCELQGVTLNNGLETIGEYAFGYCSSIVRIVIPDTVTSIGESAFVGCTSITSVKIGAGMTYVPGLFSTSPIIAYEVSGKCTAYTVDNGILYSADMSKLLAYPMMKNADSFAVPAKVKVIGAYAFYLNPFITSISGQNVTDVEESAFAGCMNLATVDFPSLKTIGETAFYFCSLSNYVIPAGVTDIGIGAFRSSGVSSFVVSEDNTEFAAKAGILYSKDLCTLVMYPDRYDESFTVPDTVTAIGNGAFAMSKLSKVTFPSTLETIGDYAFMGSNISEVTIPASVTLIGEYAFTMTFGLNKVVIETPTTNIGQAVFAMSTVSEVEFKDGVTTIGESMFSVTRITNVVLPESVGIIMDYAFSMVNIEYIYIPSGALVCEEAFEWCYFVDAAGNDLSYDELAGYAYMINENGYLVRQGYSVVSYDVNGGSEEAPESVIVADGFYVTLPDYKGTKAEYEFVGWFCNEQFYEVGESVQVMSDMTFTAVWYKDIVEVSFDIVGGAADASPVKVEIGSTYKVDGNVMTITGQSITKTITVTGTYSKTAVCEWESKEGTIIADTVFKAAFPQYVVTAMCDEEQGTVSAPATAFEGQIVELKAEPKKGFLLTGWEGWDEAENPITVENGKFTMPASDVTVVGFFDVAYTVTVKTVTGGSAVADIEYATAGTIITLSAYASTDYKFSSWSVSPSTVVVKNNKFTMPEDNVTVTPVFAFAGTKTAEVPNGKVVFTADNDIKENSKITLSITQVKSPKQSNIPSDAIVYSIKATAETGGKTVDLTDKKATVTIYVDSKDSQKKVFFVSEDGKTVENMNASYDAVEGGLVFLTTHFSDFAISEKSIEPIKDNTMIYIIIAAVILIVLIAIICLLWRAKVNKARP